MLSFPGTLPSFARKEGQLLYLLLLIPQHPLKGQHTLGYFIEGKIIRVKEKKRKPLGKLQINNARPYGEIYYYYLKCTVGKT